MVYKIYKGRKQKVTKLLLVLCSSRKYPYPQGGQRKFREEEGGSKRRQFPRGGGCLERFFPGSLGKIGGLLIYNSFSVEQAISYFTVTGVSKQVLLFSLIIYYLRSAKCKCFFHGLCDSFHVLTELK